MSSLPEGRFLVSIYGLYLTDLGRTKPRRAAMAVCNTAPCKRPWLSSGAQGRSTLRWRPSSPPPPRTFYFIPDRAYLCSRFSITVRTACKQFLAFSVQPGSHRGPKGKAWLAAAMCSVLPMLPIHAPLTAAARTPAAHRSPEAFSCFLSSIFTMNNRIIYLYILAICKTSVN